MKEAEKRELIAKVPETQSPSGFKAGGGVAFLGYKPLFLILDFNVFTPLLRLVIAMNKQYMTSLTCRYGLLISPFDNRILCCSRAVKT